MQAPPVRHLPDAVVDQLDPYVFMAIIGKRIIHPGGRRSTEELFQRANFHAGQHVLDVGCGVGTSAIAIARHYGAQVTAVDISPIMLAYLQANIRSSQVERHISVVRGDIMTLPFPPNAFDRVLAEAVTMFVDRTQAARELVRVCRPGGRVLATEFLWRKPPTPQARHTFLGEVCPGMTFDTLDDWLHIYRMAGLTDMQVSSGPFEMMTPQGFVRDEGLWNSLVIMGRAMRRRAYLHKMIWLLPRVNRAVPYLGYLAVSGVKPLAS